MGQEELGVRLTVQDLLMRHVYESVGLTRWDDSMRVCVFSVPIYRTLHCNRNSIHKNLIVALMIQVISLLVILSPSISGDLTVHREV